MSKRSVVVTDRSDEPRQSRVSDELRYLRLRLLGGGLHGEQRQGLLSERRLRGY